MKSNQLRTRFVRFFEKHGHTYVPSSSLVPANDPTLLFANAGMNQFKDVFLGKEKRAYTRAVTVQKCMRAGGKHNDLDNVGFTQRHLTFFEMLGNFSFGDYFKKEAIGYAWDFLTKDIGMPQERLYASVYKDDGDAYDLWKNTVGLPENRIVKLGAADNFWQMGETGPCGPCSEIYVDRGDRYGCGKKGCAPGCSCDRFIEIWNLVFMQFNRQPDGRDIELTRKGIDTGMGLERLCLVMQDAQTVFDTDLFAGIFDAMSEMTGHDYAHASADIKSAMRAVADHVRSVSFAIADGVMPSNEGRGYVLRKIIRRAALFARKLSDKNFFPLLIDPLISTMGGFYPELIERKSVIVSVVDDECARFAHNLAAGSGVFEKLVAQPEVVSSKTISGEAAFKLYDTYGFPVEITGVLARERGLTVDTAGFEAEMEKQRMRSGKKDTGVQTAAVALPDHIVTRFTGYDEEETQTRVTALILDKTPVEEVPAGETCAVITDASPLFVESGGQVSDRGALRIGAQEVPIEKIYTIGNARACEVVTPVALKIGDTVTLCVDRASRLNIMRNHTATHLLHAALQTIVGKTVHQAGSYVAQDYLRFDITYADHVTPEIIKALEDRVNEKIRENLPVATVIMRYQDAVTQGATALFGEKYSADGVRVVSVGGFSKELCGGTHVRATGQIGVFKITQAAALSAGVRRITAVTGEAAVMLFQEDFDLVKHLSGELKVPSTDILGAVHKLQEQVKSAATQAKELKKKLWRAQKKQWLESAGAIKNMPFVFAQPEDASADDLKDIATDVMREKSCICFLTAKQPDGRTAFYIALSPEYAHTIDLKKVKSWMDAHGLVGGGSSTMLRGSTAQVGELSRECIEEFKKL